MVVRNTDRLGYCKDSPRQGPVIPRNLCTALDTLKRLMTPDIGFRDKGLAAAHKTAY